MREVCHPDVPGELTKIYGNFVPSDGNFYHPTGANVPYRDTAPVEVCNGRGRADRMLGLVHSLSPQAEEAIPIRNEVNHIAIRRPAWFVGPAFVDCHGDPLIFRRRQSVAAKRCHKKARAVPVQSFKSHPFAIGREFVLIDAIFVALHKDTLAARNKVESANGVAFTIEHHLVVRREIIRSSAMITELIRGSASHWNDEPGAVLATSSVNEERAIGRKLTDVLARRAARHQMCALNSK